MWKHIFRWQIGKCGSNTVYYTKNTHGSDVNGSQKVLGEASLRWVNTNREKICQLRTGEAFHCIWFCQIQSKIFKLSYRLNLPVMSGSFVVIADATTRWTAWRMTPLHAGLLYARTHVLNIKEFCRLLEFKISTNVFEPNFCQQNCRTLQNQTGKSNWNTAFKKGEHKELAVYHVRERCFISPWFKHPIEVFFSFIFILDSMSTVIKGLR